MTTGGGAVGGEIFVNIRTEGSAGGGVPGAGGAPRPAGGGSAPKDPAMSLLNDKQKEQLEGMRSEKKALKEYQDFQKLKAKDSQNDLLNELQRGRKQATMVAGAVTTGMLARNSKIMSTSMGSLTTMFGAFIDVFLMPFIPLIIPVLKYIADLIPRWMDWTQKFADLFKKNPLEALKWAAEEFLKNGMELGYKIGEMFGISNEQMDSFYKTVGDLSTKTWAAIQLAWLDSVAYVKSVWEESGESVWGSIKIMAGDAWQLSKDSSKAAWEVIKTQSKAVWDAITVQARAGWEKFEAWQPETALKIENAWTSAADWVKGIWESNGCSVMGFIGGAARAAFSAAGDAVKNLWERHGDTVKAKFWEAIDSLKDGLSWLWIDSGLKSLLIGMVDSVQDWIYSKTGIGGQSRQRVTEGSMVHPSGGLYDLSTINASNNPAQNQYGGSATAPNWMQRYLGLGDMSWKDRGKDWLRAAGKNPLSKFGIGPDMDAFNQDKSMAQDAYTKHSQGSFEFHAQKMEDTGYGVRDIQDHIQNRITESYSERFQSVELIKKNGEWKATVHIQNEFVPDDKIDGMRIS